MPVVEKTRLHRGTFLVLFAGAAYLFWLTLQPIWVPVFLGLVIAVGVHPLHERLLRRLGGRHPGIPAALVTALAIVSALALLAFLVFVVGHRVVDVARAVEKRYEARGTAGLLGRDLVRFLSRFGLDEDSLRERVRQAAEEIASFVGKSASSLVGGFFAVIFGFIFTALTSYFLLREGREGTRWLVEVVPLPDGQVTEIVSDVRDVTRAMLLSTGLMSLYQGVTAGLGYWMFGVDSPLVWAVLTGIASILPALGTALVWVPIGIIVIATGHPGQGIAVLAWGAVIVVFVADYILRPKLVGTKVRMNDLLVFIAIFGGLEAFGILGLLLGPMAVAILLALLRIYQKDYRPEGPPRAPDVTAPEAAR